MLGLFIVCTFALLQFGVASTNCLLNSTSLSCSTTDNVSKYPGQDSEGAYGKGVHADVTVTNGNGCSGDILRNVKYEISVPTHFDYSSFPLEVRPEGCNAEYSFQAANTSLFLTSFSPQNDGVQEVQSKIVLESIEEGCELYVSLSMVWVDTVPRSCALLNV